MAHRNLLFTPKNSFVTNGLQYYLKGSNYTTGSSTWNDSYSTNNFTVTNTNVTGLTNSIDIGNVPEFGWDKVIYRTMTLASSVCTIMVIFKLKTWTKDFIMYSSCYPSNGTGNWVYYTNSTPPNNSGSGTPTNYIDKVEVTANPNPDLVDSNFHMFESKNVDMTTWTHHCVSYVWDYNFVGEIGAVMVYNRTLTADESTQNYNFFKAKFSLT